jgi:hypothetical protein
MKRGSHDMKRRLQFFSLMELVFALGLLMFAATLFYMAADNLNTLEKRVTAENRALQVLDNTVERLSFEGKTDFLKIKSIFEDEFSRSILSETEGVAMTCESRNGSALVTIQGKNDRRLAWIEIPIEKE